MKQTRKRQERKFCKKGCPCRNSGFLFVINQGQFKTAKGLPLSDKLVPVVCNGSKGEWINEHRGDAKLPVYDPTEMILPGEDKPRVARQPEQQQFF